MSGLWIAIVSATNQQPSSFALGTPLTEQVPVVVHGPFLSQFPALVVPENVEQVLGERLAGRRQRPDRRPAQLPLEHASERGLCGDEIPLDDNMPRVIVKSVKASRSAAK